MYLQAYFRLVFVCTCCLLASFAAQGQSAYHLQVRMTDVAREKIYLCHYYGKGRPNIFIADSAWLDNSGDAVFSSNDVNFVGGIYIILLGDRERTNFELLVNRGDNFSVTATKAKLPDGVKFNNSPENELFQEYVDFLKDFGKDKDKLTQYRRDYSRAHPGTLLSSIFNAMEVPEVPEGPHYLQDGYTIDSLFAWRYYKAHYWDRFNFHDDRLIYTPLYDARIEEYITKLTVPSADSVEKECDYLLAETRGTRDVFHYTLWWLTHYAENSKVAYGDEMFVYLVENYYAKGDAFWLTSDELSKYTERAQKIEGNRPQQDNQY